VKIISRYVLKEHLGPFTFALTALTSLMLLQYVARQFGNLVGKGLRWQVILEFFLLSIPFTVAMTLPMAVLVAVLYAFSRLASENEITALKAGGVSMRQLLLPSLSLAFVLALVMVAFNDQILPRANHRLAVLQMDIFRTKPTFALREQVLNTVKEGQLYLRAGHLDEGSSRMRDVTIYDVANPVNRRTITADSGKIELAPNQRDLVMTLYHGLMETVPTDKPGQLTRLYYMQQLMRVAGVGARLDRRRPGRAHRRDRQGASAAEATSGATSQGAKIQRTLRGGQRVLYAPRGRRPGRQRCAATRRRRGPGEAASTVSGNQPVGGRNGGVAPRPTVESRQVERRSVAAAAESL
jgi:lipopolysaccharide export system permease protein